MRLPVEWRKETRRRQFAAEMRCKAPPCFLRRDHWLPWRVVFTAFREDKRDRWLDEQEARSPECEYRPINYLPHTIKFRWLD